MAEARAKLTNLAVAPRKVRLVAGLIRGRRVEQAREILAFTDKKSAEPMRKLLDSACANAEEAAQQQSARVDTDDFVVSELQVNEGMVLARYRPAPRGRATRIRKRRSHVELVISDQVKPKKR